MNVEDILEKFNKDPNNITKLGYIGRSLGREILRKRKEVLKKFWHGLGSIPEKRLTQYTRGYRAALMDISRIVELELFNGFDGKDAKEFVLKQEYCEVLKVLVSSVKMPEELAAELNKDYCEINRILKELRDLHLVDGLTGLLHRLTPQGEQIAKTVSDTY